MTQCLSTGTTIGTNGWLREPACLCGACDRFRHPITNASLVAFGQSTLGPFTTPSCSVHGPMKLELARWRCTHCGMVDELAEVKP